MTARDVHEGCSQWELKQQLGEGWFKTMADVPTHAITLTVPAIMRCRSISCVVPDERKASALVARIVFVLNCSFLCRKFQMTEQQ